VNTATTPTKPAGSDGSIKLANAARAEAEGRTPPRVHAVPVAPAPVPTAIVIQEPTLTDVTADSVELQSLINEVEGLQRQAESLVRERRRIIEDVFADDRSEQTHASDDKLDKLEDEYNAARERMNLLLDLISIAELPEQEPNT
jgi:hypothetical protein